MKYILSRMAGVAQAAKSCYTRHADKNVLVVIDCSYRARRAMYIYKEMNTSRTDFAL